MAETATASYGGTGSGGGSDIPNGTTNPNYTATRYSVQGGSSFPVNCTPWASWSGTSSGGYDVVGGSAYVGYTCATYPATINPGGAQKANGQWYILIGQGFTPALQGIPSGCTVSNYQWTATGTTFGSWTGTAYSSSYTPNPSPNTAANPTWCWADSGNGVARQETVTCTATVTPPTGDGPAFTVTATQTVNVVIPAWMATGTGGNMYVNTLCPNENGALTLWGNMTWDATVTTPQLPVAFGTGSLQLVQLYSPNNDYYTNTIPQVEHTDRNNGNTGLDTTYPYPAIYPNQPIVQEPATYNNGDNPNIGVNPSVYSVTNDSGFQDYLMYRPPGSSQWVTLSTFSWSAFGTAIIPGAGWQSYGPGPAGGIIPSATTQFTADNTLPSWTFFIGAGANWSP